MTRGGRCCGALAVLLAASAASCHDTTAPCATPSRFAGSWRYVARQTSPGSATISGTLVVKTGACRSLQGSLDAVERDAQGVTTRVAGALDGHEVDSSSIAFDVYLPSATREHLGRLAGDSIAGSWIDGSAGGASGDFVARR
ncbi:MAG TPA: hypothetical protein VHM30_01645 [Gemmatimonadaceae bacterium]|nr:hypothetical protein [Gemmatimonadaceae bacterium]